MTDKEKIRHKERYENYKLAYAALMLCYPFGLEDIDGEEWRDIEGFEGIYQISNYGRVKSFQKGTVKILKPTLHTGGYLTLNLGRHKKFKIHRLVAKHFIPNVLNLPEIDHINGNKMDNYFKNLEWVTLRENKRRAFNNFLYPSGEKCSKAKLTNEQARWIRKNYVPFDPEYGESALARKFGVDRGVIKGIVTGKTYRRIDNKKSEGLDK